MFAGNTRKKAICFVSGVNGQKQIEVLTAKQKKKIAGIGEDVRQGKRVYLQKEQAEKTVAHPSEPKKTKTPHRGVPGGCYKIIFVSRTAILSD